MMLGFDQWDIEVPRERRSTVAARVPVHPSCCCTATGGRTRLGTGGTRPRPTWPDSCLPVLADFVIANQ